MNLSMNQWMNEWINQSIIVCRDDLSVNTIDQCLALSILDDCLTRWKQVDNMRRYFTISIVFAMQGMNKMSARIVDQNTE